MMGHKFRLFATFCCSALVEDLLKYLDPQFTDHITVPDAMKLEFILAGEKQETKLQATVHIFTRWAHHSVFSQLCNIY